MSAGAGIVIVGGGRAAASAVGELRAQGYDGHIRVVTGERHNPYDHPPLSKEYLQGAQGIDSVYLQPSSWWDDNRVQLTTGSRATTLDFAAHTVTLWTGQEIPYERLLLATGARARRLQFGGDHVHYLRTIDEGRELRAALEGGGKRVVVIGSGWIGMEVAASATKLGNTVTVVGHGIPLSNALGDDLGRLVAGVHERNGVTLLEGAVADVDATGVTLEGGERLDADVVVAGVGAAPEVALAETAGLAVQNGILVAASLQTGSEDVWAAGDVANAMHPVIGRRMRNEHWANASAQGVTAARSLLGQDVIFDEIPYFFTDQFEFSMELSGYPPLMADARVAYRGDPAGLEFIAFWLDDEDRVIAGMNVNTWDVNERVQELIRGGRPVDFARLVDPAVDLASI